MTSRAAMRLVETHNAVMVLFHEYHFQIHPVQERNGGERT